MSQLLNKKEIRQDRLLRGMMYAGLPIALIAILSLWLGRSLASPALGMLFVVAMPVALALGLAYNIRFIVLANRARKQQAEQ